MPKHGKQYRDAAPFPHAVIEDFRVPPKSIRYFRSDASRPACLKNIYAGCRLRIRRQKLNQGRRNRIGTLDRNVVPGARDDSAAD